MPKIRANGITRALTLGSGNNTVASSTSSPEPTQAFTPAPGSPLLESRAPSAPAVPPPQIPSAYSVTAPTLQVTGSAPGATGEPMSYADMQARAMIQREIADEQSLQRDAHTYVPGRVHPEHDQKVGYTTTSDVGPGQAEVDALLAAREQKNQLAMDDRTMRGQYVADADAVGKSDQYKAASQAADEVSKIAGRGEKLQDDILSKIEAKLAKLDEAGSEKRKAQDLQSLEDRVHFGLFGYNNQGDFDQYIKMRDRQIAQDLGDKDPDKMLGDIKALLGTSQAVSKSGMDQAEVIAAVKLARNHEALANIEAMASKLGAEQYYRGTDQIAAQLKEDNAKLLADLSASKAGKKVAQVATIPARSTGGGPLVSAKDVRKEHREMTKVYSVSPDKLVESGKGQDAQTVNLGEIGKGGAPVMTTLKPGIAPAEAAKVREKVESADQSLVDLAQVRALTATPTLAYKNRETVNAILGNTANKMSTAAGGASASQAQIEILQKIGSTVGIPLDMIGLRDTQKMIRDLEDNIRMQKTEIRKQYAK